MIHILVVDDDPKLTQAVCTYLNSSGYQAKGCLSAQAAYDAMYSQLYDLIISDIMMPGTDGFHFAKTVRSRPSSGCASCWPSPALQAGSGPISSTRPSCAGRAPASPP